MSINEQFLAARAAEQRFRLMVHARAVCWIRMHSRNGKGVFAHTPIAPLTQRHRIELSLVRCAFFAAGEPSEADVLVFLWRLHPHYRAAVIGREKWLAARAPGFLCRFLFAYAYGSLQAGNAYVRLASLVRHCDVAKAAQSIRAFLLQSDQDEPGIEESNVYRPRIYSSAAPDRCGADNFVDYAVKTFRLTPDQALDIPIALLHQLYREQLLATPDGELAVFAPSDALL
jgi:hypothetical protein